MIFNLDDPTVLSRVDLSNQGATFTLGMKHEMTKSRGTIVRVTT